MARQSLILHVDNATVKLRLTLKGQKALAARSPGSSPLACVMGAIDDAEDLEALLTEALNWDGNDNTIHSGDELYDALVDAGYCGNEAFAGLVFDIAHNAGLLSGDERDKLKRSTSTMLRRNIDALVANMLQDGEMLPVGAEEPSEQEGAEDPLANLQTLDG